MEAFTSTSLVEADLDEDRSAWERHLSLKCLHYDVCGTFSPGALQHPPDGDVEVFNRGHWTQGQYRGISNSREGVVVLS